MSLQVVASGLQVAFDTLDKVAKEKKGKLVSVTLDVGKTDLNRGVVVGTAKVKMKPAARNGERTYVRNVDCGFRVEPGRNGVVLKFLTKTVNLAA